MCVPTPTPHRLWPGTLIEAKERGLSEAHAHTGYSGHLETRYVKVAFTLEAGSGWLRQAQAGTAVPRLGHLELLSSVSLASETPVEPLWSAQSYSS